MEKTAKSVGVIEHLNAMRNLLVAPERWTKSLSARNASGDIERPTSPSAACWCIVGASIRAHNDLRNSHAVADDALDRLDRASPAPPGRGIVWFNDLDGTTHADILAVLDRAIELAKQEGTTP